METRSHMSIAAGDYSCLAGLDVIFQVIGRIRGSVSRGTLLPLAVERTPLLSYAI